MNGQSSVISHQSSVISDQPAVEEGTTVKLYGAIVDYGEEHRKAVAALSQAVARGDENAMKKAFDAITYFERMQRQAAIETREHLRKKAEFRMQKAEGEA